MSKVYLPPSVRQDCAYVPPRSLACDYYPNGDPKRYSEEIPSCSRNAICPVCQQCLTDNGKTGHCPCHHNLLTTEVETARVVEA